MRLALGMTGLAAFLATAATAAYSSPDIGTGTNAVPLVRHQVATPADLYGDLFVQVQMRQIFADGKTFVDAKPKRDPAWIMAEYRLNHFADDAALRKFVLDSFDVPGEATVPAPAMAENGPRLPIEGHIAALWPHLTRQAVDPVPGGSALALPEPFVVPGGRFRELYYWDSYFTMLGLKADGQEKLIDSMIDDFASLVDRYGHVPNGTRTYYVSRSQPPFLYLMMGLSDSRDRTVLLHRLDVLKREHDFWMRGAQRLAPDRRATARVVRMPDGSILNRYWDDRDTPRDESYREDVLTAQASDRPAGRVYRDLRAAAESGWDFSSRWLADGKTLSTIDTTAIAPVDLNSLLYGMERDIAARARALGEEATAHHYAAAAEARRHAIEKWLWNPETGYYCDWDVARQRLKPALTAATAYPLFVKLAAPDRAVRVADAVESKLLAPGGLRTTLVDTDQQWDRPNGWPPLQWIAVAGLRNYGDEALAKMVGTRFLDSVLRTYRATGKLVEKYDVEEALPGGGGEYPLQDGFGWTNGVTLALIDLYGIPTDATTDD